MTRAKTLVPIVIAVLFAVSACNLPTAQGGGQTPSIVAMVSVSAATEYRTGPGPAYAVVGMLQPGQQVEAVGRSPDGAYLLIRDPSNPAASWWLKSDAATVTGNAVGLQIFTPPPTPSPVAGGLTGGCPSPVGGGPTPVDCSASIINVCPSPIGGGPTPVDCTGSTISGCPSPIGGGPTPVDCTGSIISGCPSPVGGGPTPVDCTGSTISGCPSPVGGGPTPVDCSGSTISGCPSPIGGGPTPVNCTSIKPAGPPTTVGDYPTPVPGVPTPIPAPKRIKAPTPVRGANASPTPIQ